MKNWKGCDGVELQIGDLISSIKKDGIQAAEAESEKIIAQAKERAAAIIESANDEAARIKEKTAKELELLRESARTDADHARRDAVLSFRGAVQSEFEKILAADISKTVREETLAKLILAVLGDEDPSLYTAEVSEVTEGLKNELAQKIKAGLEIRISPAVRRGFRLASKDQSGYFDCSDEEITGMLMNYFSDLRM